MLQFKQKQYIAPLLGGLVSKGAIKAAGGEIATNAAIGALANAPGTILQAKANKDNKELAEEQARQQKRDADRALDLQKKELKMKQDLAKTANKDPMAAATALQSIQQKSYSNKTVKEGIGFVKNLANTSRDSAIGRGVKGLIGTAVSGALTAGGVYAVDKAIQKNAKKSGLDIAYEDTEEDKETRKKSRRKRALKLGSLALATVGGTVAAKKGLFGTDIKNVADKINKDNIKKAGIKVGKYAKEGIKDMVSFRNEKTGKRSPSYLGIAITAAPIVTPIARYVISKKQLKEQIKQSEDDEGIEKRYSERKEETPENRVFLVYLKKKIKNSCKEKEKTYTFTLKRKKNKKPRPKEPIENRIFKTYLSFKARGYSQVGDWFKKQKNNFKISYKSFKKRPGTFTLDFLSKFKGGDGLKGTNSFGRRLQEAGEKSGNITSQKVGKFIKENPKKSLIGSILIGAGILKAGQLGFKKTRKFIEDHDKNAYAYEKSQGMIVPKELKNEENNDN